ARGRRGRSRRGEDLKYRLEISLEEAARGMETKLQIPRHESCETCRGTGQQEGPTAGTCGTCRGPGPGGVSQGLLPVARPCPACGGAGTLNRYPCSACRGEGRV